MLLAACLFVGVTTWFFDSSFAKAFVASCIVSLPLFWLYVLPPTGVRSFLSRMHTTHCRSCSLRLFESCEENICPPVAQRSIEC